MSVLETPRILFRGQIAWDPIVTNNYESFYNECTSQTVLSPGETVQAFRQAAIQSVKSGNWNPHGTHRSVMFETAVSGVDLGNGVVLDDPFVTAPVAFSGMLVDLEPYGTFTSQLFFDTMNFGIAGGCRIVAPRTSRFTDRYINFSRNLTYKVIAGVASVVWQTSFAKTQGLRIDAHGSTALQALSKALEDDDVLGLTVRWNAYRTLYYNTQDKAALPGLQSQLVERLEGGGFQPNPSRSMLVGVVGLWRRGEPAHEPGDRALLSTEAQTGPVVATAHARLSGSRLTLDLSNSVSETGVDLVKQPLGDLSVVAVDPASGKDLATLGTFDYSQYDRAAYERSSGIVTLPVDPGVASQAAKANLELRQANGTVLLREEALRALPTAPNTYLDEGQSTTVQVQVFDRGAPAPAGVDVTVATLSADGGTVVETSVVQTGEGGLADVNISSTKGGGVVGYMLVPGSNPTIPDGIDPQLTTYMYVRTLPADADIAQLPATWENVYAKVLSNWNAMAPCMDNWLRLDDAEQVRAYGPVLKRLTDPSQFESFRFMPVTRDMTAGERTLLYAFLDGTKALHAMSEAAEPEQKDNVKLSRAMRSH
ncbi:hypothetical protein ATI61_109343 [Archangium gephyra]|uniref:Uncharacterized protein n=1 Tax=Archangium gephyra TaxID=48 RepID=A0AAC8Q1V2_9BACT|nr:hypothetical protein [Archangium gephyra]AKI99454.1 Hypothetical protein AA314_01081 [Archangium gephyra]REG28001.1 hypothetical protein ATI61_109343 [Archangium gephyra]